jgi:hypothetical protein
MAFELTRLLPFSLVSNGRRQDRSLDHHGAMELSVFIKQLHLILAQFFCPTLFFLLGGNFFDFLIDTSYHSKQY